MDSNENYRSLIRCIGWFGLIIPKLRNITQVVRILPPPRAWIGVRLAHAKPLCFGDSRDSKNDSIFGARREIQRRRRHVLSCMGAQTAKATGPICEKPWENQGFTSGEDRNRTFGCFPCVLEEFERCLDKIP